MIRLPIITVINIYNIIMTTAVFLFVVSCAINKKFVRINPEFQTIRENIDSIAVLCDAIAAINKSADFYSVNASYTLDSLVLYGVTKSLSKKGYTVTPVKPCLMGSFLDTVLTVPIQMVKLSPVPEMAGATEVIHDVNFGRNARPD